MKKLLKLLGREVILRAPFLDSISTLALPRIVNTVTSRKQIWQCATPKSASTFLNRILAALWEDDCCTGSPVPYFGDRTQEPDIYSMFRRIRKSNRPYYSGHLHQRCTEFMRHTFLVNQASLGGGVIVQKRDIKDTIASFKDHIDKDFKKNGKIKGPWFVSLQNLWPLLSEDERYHAIAMIYTFWHIDFANSWKGYERAITLDYTDVTQETSSVVSEICRYFHFEKSQEQIDTAIMTVNTQPSESKRFNIGQSGRGVELLPSSTQDYIEEVKRLLSR